MLNAANRNTGQSVATPDVCNTPTGTGVDVPTPYVNTASNTQAVAFATTVMIEGGNALNQTSSVPTTTGDESGTSHPVTKQEARYTMGNPTVFIEQTPAVTFSSLSTGNAMNASVGSVSVASAATVYFTCAPSPGADLPAPGSRISREDLAALGRAVACGGNALTVDDSAGGALVVRIARFTEDVGTELARALHGVPSSRALVVDLRQCPGGDLDAAIALASDFLDDGAPIAIVRDADGDDDLRRARGLIAYAHPLTLQVDSGTASAAEVFAFALESAGRARVVGGPTYGKTTVQRVVLDASGASYRTVATVRAPDGPG